MGHSNEDALFLHSIPTGVLNEFRSEMYSGAYIRKNPAMFVDTAWVEQENPRVERAPDLSTSIKRERDASPCLVIKKEPVLDATTFGTATRSLFRSVTENGHEVLELFSSDDEDSEETSKVPSGLQVEDIGMSSDTMVGDITMDSDDDELDPHLLSHRVKKSQANTSDMDSSASDSGDESDHEAGGAIDGVEPTLWLDDSISSTVCHYGKTKITRQCYVSVVEYLSELPSYWPVPRESRAFILDLSDSKFNIEDNAKPGKLMTPDALFKDSQQDSWSGPSGTKDSHPKVDTSVFGLTDGGKVDVRRTRLKCGGCRACEHVNPALLNHQRYELDPESLQDVLKIQIDTRLREADTPEKHALIFFAICHSSACTAKNDRGQTCTGVPQLVKFNNNVMKNGHRYFVSCNKWSTNFSEGHRTSFIPSGVKDEHLLILFSGESLPGFEEPLPCGRIVSAHIGARVLTCNFPHFGNGLQAALIQHPCSASLTGFIPEDENYPELSRMICIVFNEAPHNHPILPPTKTPATIKEIYRDCVKKAGIVGSSVRTIDNAQTTKLALGSSPSLYNPTLQNNRIKQDIIRDVKKKIYPCGTDLPGVIHCMNEDLGKPIEERYIHGFAVTKNDGRIIVTANPFLLSRIHFAKTIFVDTTFKRTVSTLKEWEVVMYDKAAERALTIARVYTDRADRLQYKTIFDELQRVTFQLTGQHLRLKRLSKDGTLVSIGVDMELAQALGAGDSFLPTNDPAFSNINVHTAEEIIEYFVRSCYTHAKRGVHDLCTYVDDKAYDRLMNFMYLETEEEVDNFSAWVKGLKNPKVQAWWDHKVNNRWILPSLIKCLSKMDSEDWDLTPPTTNVGESQHHWTNINTGVMLSLLEAILTARELDDKVAAEVNATLSTTGVLKSTRNDTFTRMARSTARTTHAYKKVKETRHQKKAINIVDSQLASLRESQKENNAKIKELKATKSTLTSHSGRSSKAESSSSGKIAVTGMSKRTRANAAEKAVIMKKAADNRKYTTSTSTVSSTSNTATNYNFGEPAVAAAANLAFTPFDWSENGMQVFDFCDENSVEGASWTEAAAALTLDISMSATEPQPFLPENISLNVDLMPPFADMTAAANFFTQTPLVSDNFPLMDSFGLDSCTEALFDNFLASRPARRSRQKTVTCQPASRVDGHAHIDIEY